MNEIIKFNDGEIEIVTKLEDENIWITQKQMCELFGRDKSVISRHINNIFKSGELDKNSVVANFATTASDGKTIARSNPNEKDLIIKLITNLIGE